MTTSAIFSSPSDHLPFYGLVFIGGFISLQPLVKLSELDDSISTSSTIPNIVKRERLSNVLA